MSIKADFKGVQKALDRLQAGVARHALASAVNKTVGLAQTQMVREITSEFNVTAAYVRERLRVRRAAAKGALAIEGALIGGKGGKGRSANIIAFLEKVTTLAEAKKRGKAGTLNQLFVKVKKTGPKKPLGKGAFIGNNGRTVFERVGKERLPIKPVQVIDVAQMFNTRRINAKVVQVIKARLPDVFAREARFYVQRFNRGQGSS